MGDYDITQEERERDRLIDKVERLEAANRDLLAGRSAAETSLCEARASLARMTQELEGERERALDDAAKECDEEYRVQAVCLQSMAADSAARCGKRIRALKRSPSPATGPAEEPAAVPYVGKQERVSAGRCPCGGELVRFVGARTPQAQCLKCKAWSFPAAPIPKEDAPPVKLCAECGEGPAVGCVHWTPTRSPTEPADPSPESGTARCEFLGCWRPDSEPHTHPGGFTDYLVPIHITTGVAGTAYACSNHGLCRRGLDPATTSARSGKGCDGCWALMVLAPAPVPGATTGGDAPLGGIVLGIAAEPAPLPCGCRGLCDGSCGTGRSPSPTGGAK